MVKLYATQLAEAGIHRDDSNFWAARGTAEQQNENAIRDYKFKRSIGGLPEQAHMENKYDAPQVIESYSGHRRMSDTLVDLLNMALPNCRPYANEWFPGLLSYNEDLTVNVFLTQRDFIVGKKTSLRFGKYLVKTGQFTEDEANSIANRFKSAVRTADDVHLCFAEGADAIEAVYEHGPHSCMAGASNRFYGHCHPARVYDSPDIKVAYVMLAGRIVARTVCNAVDKEYSVIYGNAEMLELLLEKAGYTPGGIQDCRIRRIEDDKCPDTYVMPYIDGADSVSIFDHQYFVVDDSGEYSCNETEGLSNSAGYGCEHCGANFHEEDMYLSLIHI